MTDIKDYITNDYKAIDSHETIGAAQDFFADLIGVDNHKTI